METTPTGTVFWRSQALAKAAFPMRFCSPSARYVSAMIVISRACAVSVANVNAEAIPTMPKFLATFRSYSIWSSAPPT
jgi:hypothetical protein